MKSQNNSNRGEPTPPLIDAINWNGASAPRNGPETDPVYQVLQRKIANGQYAHNRKYHDREDAFLGDGPDTMHALGITLTDGSITRGGILSYKVAAGDEDILYHISDYVGSGRPVLPTVGRINGVEYPQVYLRFTNSMLIINLLKRGLRSRGKDPGSLQVVPPDLAECLHFWRGVFDGDGGLSFDAKGSFDLGLTNRVFPILQGFEDYVVAKVALRGAQHRKWTDLGNGTKTLVWSGRQRSIVSQRAVN